MTMHNAKCIVSPSALSLPLSLVKTFLRIDGDQEEELLRLLILSATIQFEKYTGKALLKQRWSVTYRNVKNDIVILPTTPAISLVKLRTMGIDNHWCELDKKYCDIDNDRLYMQTLSYHPVFEVIYDAGITDDRAKIPSSIQSALLQHIGHMYNVRCTKSSNDRHNKFPLNIYDQFKDIVVR